MSSLRLDVDAFETRQGPGFDHYPSSGLEVRPRFMSELRTDQLLKGRNFRFRDRNRRTIETYDLNESGRRDDGKSIENVESTEQIAREQWRFNFLHAVRPASPALKGRQKALIALSAEVARHSQFKTGSNMQGKPRQVRVLRRCGYGLRSSDLVCELFRHLRVDSGKLPPFKSQNLVLSGSRSKPHFGSDRRSRFAIASRRTNKSCELIFAPLELRTGNLPSEPT